MAKRGHICKNGAGNAGCMGAMNQGITDSNGRVVGVTHEIFIKPGMTSRWKGEDLHNIFKDRDKRKVHLLVVGGQDLKEKKKKGIGKKCRCYCSVAWWSWDF